MGEVPFGEEGLAVGAAIDVDDFLEDEVVLFVHLLLLHCIDVWVLLREKRLALSLLARNEPDWSPRLKLRESELRPIIDSTLRRWVSYCLNGRGDTWSAR